MTPIEHVSDALVCRVYSRVPQPVYVARLSKMLTTHHALAWSTVYSGHTVPWEAEVVRGTALVTLRCVSYRRLVGFFPWPRCVFDGWWLVHRLNWFHGLLMSYSWHLLSLQAACWILWYRPNLVCKEAYIEQDWFKIIYCFNGEYFNSLFSEISNKCFYKYFTCLF